MRAISIGHAGILVETDAGSILCDPWFVPAFFGAWFVFPRNDQLDPTLLERIESADFLYLSHLHGDHQDVPWLRRHLRRDIPIVLPGFPSREQERSLQALGFTEFIRTVPGQELDLAPGLTVAIHTETSLADGPGGDSAIVVSDGRTRLVNQNDCRSGDIEALAAHGPVDLHWLQHSGAIWYPMVYDLEDEEKRRLCRVKVENQLTRAMRYVQAIDARAVVPSAGPPAFLDDELFHLNVIHGEEASIFADQRAFLGRLASAKRTGILAVPGTAIDVAPGGITVEHPMPDDEVSAIFENKEAYLRRYQADWRPWLEDLHAGWHRPPTNLVATLKEWWEPLLRMAPTMCSAIGANCLLQAGALEILIDFPNAEVRGRRGEPYAFRYRVPRALVEIAVAERTIDWSNSLFLSCRWTAWREGPFDPYVANFFKCLSPERIRRAEADAVEKGSETNDTKAEIELGDYVVQRWCPHRRADLRVFGEIERGTHGPELVCAMHGWRFDCRTGRCLTAADHAVAIRRRDQPKSDD